MAEHDKKYPRGSIARPQPAFDGGNGLRNGAGQAATGRDKRASQSAGWDAYRGWLSKMDRSVSRRRGARSIYTWKGYKAWAAKIRANWDADKAE